MTTTIEVGAAEVQFVDEPVTAMLAKAELDQQITTARAYPRSLSQFRKDCIEMATLNEQVARECIYALPRKEDGEAKMIEGPSARLGEIVMSAWGNCAAGARVVREDNEFVYAQGFFFDLERNVRINREVRRRITNRSGRRYSSDMIAVTANAACSIAQRNAVFAGIPKAFWHESYQRARQVIAGDAETFSKRRAEAIDTAKKMGATPERIFAALSVDGVADIGVDELVQLTGLTTAVKDGEIKLDEAFPGPARPESNKGGVAGLKEKLAPIAPEPAASGSGEAGAPPTEAAATVVSDMDQTSPPSVMPPADPAISDLEVWSDFHALALKVEKSFNGERRVLKEAPKKGSGQWYLTDPAIGEPSTRLFDGIGIRLTVPREQLAQYTAKLEELLS